jgi:hypothetical protein
VVHICVQLQFGTSAGKETVVKPCTQLCSSFSESFSISQEKIGDKEQIRRETCWCFA